MGAETADRRPKCIHGAGDYSKRFFGGILTLMKISIELWVPYAEPERKAQSVQWKQAGSPPPEKYHLLTRLCWLPFGIHVK